MLEEITPMVLTFNEAPNIERTLKQLQWAKRILVLDSYSTDDTLAIARLFPQVNILQRRFDSFAGQCNFGLGQIATPWVLSLDADYVLSNDLQDEILSLPLSDGVSGFSVAFTYCIFGRALRDSLYPPRVVLYRKERAQYRDEGHGHRVQVDGRVDALRGRIFHDDRKPLDRWFAEQNTYAIREARHLLGTRANAMKPADRVRRWIVPAPILIFLYTLFAKRLFLDGWPGFFYVLQRTLAEVLLSLRLIEARLAGNVPPR